MKQFLAFVVEARYASFLTGSLSFPRSADPRDLDPEFLSDCLDALVGELHGPVELNDHVLDASGEDVWVGTRLALAADSARVVLNNSQATSTNAIHRVTWTNDTDGKGAVAGGWTSLFRLSAEILGRSYGGGVLKLELRASAMLRVPVGTADDLLEIDEVARGKSSDAASQVADRLILRELGLSQAECVQLREAARKMAAARQDER